MNEQELVFMSSRQKELQQIRLGLKIFLEKDAVFKKIFKVVLFEDDLVGRRESPQQLYIEWVKKSDVYVGIFDRDISSAVQEEYGQAVSDKIVKKEIIICVRKPTKSGRNGKLRQFLKKIMDPRSGHSVIEFEALDDLKPKLREALLRYWHRKHETHAIGPAHLGFPKEFPKNSNISEKLRRRLLQPVGRRIKVNKSLGVVESYVYNEDGDLIDVTKDYLGPDVPKHVQDYYADRYKKPAKEDQRREV